MCVCVYVPYEEKKSNEKQTIYACVRLLIDVKPLACLPACSLARSFKCMHNIKKKTFFLPLETLFPFIVTVARCCSRCRTVYIVASNGFVFFCLYTLFHNADVRYTITCECVCLPLARSISIGECECECIC